MNDAILIMHSDTSREKNFIGLRIDRRDVRLDNMLRIQDEANADLTC